MPSPPREVKPHPYGVDLEMMKMMLQLTTAENLSDFLIREFQCIGEVTARNILNNAGLPPTANPHRLTLEDVDRLVRTIKKMRDIKPPRAYHLSYLGEEIIETGLNAILRPEFVAAVTRKPSVYEGHAFVVEVGLAYGGGIKASEKPQLLRYANKIPLLYDEGSDVSFKIVNDEIDWGYYGVSFPAPLVVLVHICSTKIPYKGVGKESIADVPEIEKEIISAIREVARRLKLYLSKKRKEIEEAEKAVTIAKYIPEVAQALAKIVDSINSDNIESRLLKLLNQKLKAFKIKSVNEVVVSIE